MQSVLVGIFDTQAAAERARTQLTAAGFTPDAVSMHSGASGMSSGADSSMSTGTASSLSTASSAAPEQEGAISRFFHSLFGSDDASTDRDAYGQTYGEALRRGAFGVTVRTASDDETDRAVELLNSAGAVDVDERAQQWRNEGWTGGTAATGTAASSGTAPAAAISGGTQKLQEVEERLNVGKRTVAKGGVRVFSRVVEVPVEESVHLRDEKASVQRRTVDRPATEADLAALKDASIEVRESSEEAVVGKTARVVGEVEIGKVVTERDETVRDTVRKTQVDVEQIEGSDRTLPGSDKKI